MDYISCSNGHYYNQDLPECPFCKTPGNVPGGPTVNPTHSPGGEVDGKTVIETPTPTKTEGNTKPISTTPFTQTDDADRTRIVRPGGVEETDSASDDRKIIGWLVTYDPDSSGVDYRMREGQNSVGRSKDCKIHVTNDHELSGNHGMFLFRQGELWFRDEMASNATEIDGTPVGPGQTVAVKDGAQIKMGSYVYLYRAAGF